MTPKEWIEKAKTNRGLLRDFVQKWHPGTKVQVTPLVEVGDGVVAIPEALHITAPNAEAARQVVAKQICKNKVDPVISFEQALDTGKAAEALRILGETWFGVPESTSCWNIPGFTEAVDLLDDPPEEDDERPQLED